VDEEREVEWQDREKINDRKWGDHKAEATFYGVGICRVQGADPEAQEVFNGKNDDRYQVNDGKCPEELYMKPGYRFKNDHGHVQEDQKDHEIIKIAGKS